MLIKSSLLKAFVTLWIRQPAMNKMYLLNSGFKANKWLLNLHFSLDSVKLIGFQF